MAKALGPFPTLEELEARLEDVRRSPADRGRIAMLVVRPKRETRLVPSSVELRADVGVVGDSWLARGSTRTVDDRADPATQVTLMSARALGGLTPDRDRWALAGDQLIVDLDLGEANLPAGSRLAVGTAVVEITPVPHTGCDKFRERYGDAALRWVDSPEGRRLRLRGAMARVVRDGLVRVGDEVIVMTAPDQSVQV
jgi:hypothetical protein